MNKTLSQRLAGSEALLAPGAYDPLSALMIENAGFEAVYLSGAAISYTQLGRPDIGLVSLDHVVDVTARIRERVSVPIIVDADTGFGGSISARRTIKLLERAGASAMQIEDQSFPKRCGHLAGKTVISVEEMCGKLAAVLDARESAETLVIARTDAISVIGFEEAIERAVRYRETGADVIFVEAPRTEAEMRAIVKALPGVPLIANMVEGGTTPPFTLAQLSDMGFKLVISPGALVRNLVHQAEVFLKSLRENGSTQPMLRSMLDFKGLNERLGIDEMATLGDRYDPGLKLELYRAAAER
ncbi:oxaloacetate decarboxylase [Caulobacter sp. 602-1]|uniref:isocitrate lyase/PEP mutase family protein n=1 Tax=Caulobacter sp. 602-1 TaxID=2492472 RepID=UPI000F62CB6A|nr:isocitrate lyase/PEP mutase family protein [Caulobacter sp. 602-1]RRN66048.1 isocitrate lyase/PEP mutase family protein [Caulobacter sp. 602-1]